MSVSDEMMWSYFDLLTRVPAAEIASLRAGHPMDAKKRLARVITAQYHGERAAEGAEAHFARVHQRRDVPEEGAIEGKVLPPRDAPWPVWLVLKEAGLVQSTSEARRMIQQGAVEIDRQKVTSLDQTLATGQGYLVQVGKRRFKRVVLEGPRV
jgi:tyrosyl-tRNA synthetase